MRGRKASERVQTAEKKAQTLRDLFHELSQPITTLCCCLEISLKQARGTRLRHDLGIALEQAQAVMKLTRAIRERVEQDRESVEAQVRPSAAERDGQGGGLGGHNFPIVGALPKTGNNLPL
jgi:hypothetical protein